MKKNKKKRQVTKSKPPKLGGEPPYRAEAGGGLK